MNRILQAVGWWVAPWHFDTVPDARTRLLEWGIIGLLLGVAFWLRIRGLDAVGIFGDEKYMGHAVRGVLEHGIPLLPSDMLYPRALTQTYLMSLAAMLFGDGVWAYRLPSAIAGTACVGVAYALGRQSMSVLPSVAFAAAIAFFPSFIEISQIARMYIFLVLSSLTFLLVMSRWVRTGSWAWAVGLMLVIAVAIDLQRLAVFLLPMAALPFVLNPTTRRALQTAIIWGWGVLVYVAIEAFVARQYAGTLSAEGGVEGRYPSPFEITGYQVLPMSVIIVLLTIATAAVIFVLMRSRPWRSRPGATSGSSDTPALALGLAALALGLIAAALVAWPAALLLTLAGTALFLRGGGAAKVLVGVVLVLSLLAVIQLGWVLPSAPDDGIKDMAKRFLAVPSPVPVLVFLQLFPLAAPLYGAFAAWGLWRFARGEPLPWDVLLAVLGVLIPMLVMGMVLWSVAPRYLFGLVPVFLFCLYVAVDRQWRIESGQGSPAVLHAAPFVILTLAVVLVPPGGLQSALDRSYARYPDHGGAAEYVRRQPRSAGDLVIAMDAPIQTYYLGRLDYLLRYRDSVGWQARRQGDRVVDIFTGTTVLLDGQDLEAVLNDPGRGVIHLIGSGEIVGDHAEAFNLGPAIRELLDRQDPEEVFVGRDGMTRVWRFAPAEPRS